MIENRPAAALFSTATGASLSLSTAGVLSYFTVTARDIIRTAEEIDTEQQRIDWQGRGGREIGGLSATFYHDTEFSNPEYTLIQETVSLFTANSTLTKELVIPTPADPADIVHVDNAGTLGVSVGSDIYVDQELMRVLSVSSNTLNVARGQGGTASVFHVKGANVNSVVVSNLKSMNGYSARWSGLLRPEYAETYTFTGAVSEIDERMKLWIEDVIVIDAWSSITSTTLTGTWVSPSENGFYSIKLEYKEQYGKDGCSPSWKSGSQTLEVVPSDKLYVGNSKIHAEIASMGGGIMQTVSTTRGSSDEELLAIGNARLLQALRNGTTFVEAKSGYGLSTEHELRLLKVVDQLK